MLDVMYELPSNEKISKCVVTKSAILGQERPKLIEGERSKPDKPSSDSETKIENAS